MVVILWKYSLICYLCSNFGNLWTFYVSSQDQAEIERMENHGDRDDKEIYSLGFSRKGLL